MDKRFVEILSKALTSEMMPAAGQGQGTGLDSAEGAAEDDAEDQDEEDEQEVEVCWDGVAGEVGA
jgi:hypothetical protein